MIDVSRPALFGVCFKSLQQRILFITPDPLAIPPQLTNPALCSLLSVRLSFDCLILRPTSPGKCGEESTPNPPPPAGEGAGRSPLLTEGGRNSLSPAELVESKRDAFSSLACLSSPRAATDGTSGDKQQLYPAASISKQDEEGAGKGDDKATSPVVMTPAFMLSEDGFDGLMEREEGEHGSGKASDDSTLVGQHLSGFEVGESGGGDVGAVLNGDLRQATAGEDADAGTVARESESEAIGKTAREEEDGCRRSTSTGRRRRGPGSGERGVQRSAKSPRLSEATMADGGEVCL